jgi:hypothetical protein
LNQPILAWRSEELAHFLPALGFSLNFGLEIEQSSLSLGDARALATSAVFEAGYVAGFASAAASPSRGASTTA